MSCRQGGRWLGDGIWESSAHYLVFEAINLDEVTGGVGAEQVQGCPEVPNLRSWGEKRTIKQSDSNLHFSWFYVQPCFLLFLFQQISTGGKLSRQAHACCSCVHSGNCSAGPSASVFTF